MAAVVAGERHQDDLPVVRDLGQQQPGHTLEKGAEGENNLIQTRNFDKGGAVADWSKALLLSGEKINENQKNPGLSPSPGTSKFFCLGKP